ncbi:putative receptor-binding protein [Rhodococcus phage Toil]|uniref:Putative receptor-binding protein n=1 Tax=Rhodococcus phage Toil TaxID=1975614 RepID=A0A1W6DXQ3_9VIRU|nr:tail protein [Rhodococcus phage Toil]ARK07713.1 putative receptor-binding protein [Rhodococcus phage Toil]
MVWRYTTMAPDLSDLVTQSELTTGLGGKADTSTVDELNTSIVNTADSLAAYIAQQNASQSGGISIISNFNGTNGDPLPSTFVQDAQNGLYIWDNCLDIGAPFVAFTDKEFWYRSNIPLTMDDQSVSIVFQGKPTSQPTIIYLRGSSTGGGFVYASFVNNTIRIGWGSFTSSHFNAGTVWQTTGYTLPNNAQVEFKAVGTTYQVFVNGNPSPIASITNGTFPIGPSNRYVGGVQEVSNGAFFGTEAAPISSFNASDVAAPVYLGHGWDLYRANIGGVSKGTGNSVLPAGTFDNIRDAYGVDTTFALSNGIITATKAGWYSINLRIHISVGAGSNNICALLYGNQSVGSIQLLRAGGDIQQVSCCAASWNIYLEAGGWVQAGMNNGTGLGKSIIGDTTGYITYFSGARMYDRN